MNAEQLRKEFEAYGSKKYWDLSKLRNGSYWCQELDDAFDVYCAAAQSRDELIGKFLERIGKIAKIYGDNELDSDRKLFCIGMELGSAKRELNAQGYGE